jgi:hypothetical protein
MASQRTRKSSTSQPQQMSFQVCHSQRLGQFKFLMPALSLTKQLFFFLNKKRHILQPENSTLQWNMISAPLEYTLSQSICLNLHEWHPVQKVNVCPHEFWLVLDLDQDGWKIYDKFTLRLSWPAYVCSLHCVSGFRFNNK